MTGLYAASAPVPDQSAAARQKAFRQDLAAVLIKVSGNPDAPQVSALAPVIANAANLVVEYRYQQQSAAYGAGLVLRARFDPKTVDNALGKAGQSIWGRDRPMLIAWVLTPSGILSDNPDSPVTAATKTAARTRGLPFVLPLMDLTDQQAVSGFDIRTLFLSALRSASKRYSAQAMLVGTITYANQGISSRWSLAFGRTQAPFSITAASPAAAAAAAVGRAATLLAENLAYQPGSAAGVVQLVVNGVTSLAAEVQVRKIASSVQGVSSVTLLSVSGSVARYRLNYAGVPSDLARALGLSGSMTQRPTPFQPTSPGTVARAATATAPAASATSTGGNSVPTLYFHYGS